MLPDGSWRVLSEKAAKKATVNTVAGTSAPPSIVKSESVGSSNVDSYSAPPSERPPQSAPDVITLDDSDTEDNKNEAPLSVASSSTSQAESRKRPHDQISTNEDRRQEVQEMGIITIDDSSDEETLAPQHSASANVYPIEAK